MKRYRDERDAIEYPRMKFNILWSNIQVLFPSLYGRQAKPEVSRRYMDADPVGRLASTMLERVIEFETQQFPDYDSAMRGVVEDRLLPGRGTAWIRYAPTITTQPITHLYTDEEGRSRTARNRANESMRRTALSTTSTGPTSCTPRLGLGTRCGVLVGGST